MGDRRCRLAQIAPEAEEPERTTSPLPGQGGSSAASLPDWSSGGSPFLVQQGEEKRGGAPVVWEEEEGELQGAGVQTRGATVRDKVRVMRWE